MADAPEAAFSADERFPKYPVTTNEEEVSIGSPSRLSPLEEHNNTLLETQYPTEKSRFTSPLRSQPSQPFLPSPALATTAPVSPWNQTSPPQYAVDTPTTPTRPAQFPTYITPERQDSARAPAAPQIKSIPAVQGGEEGKWRIGLCDCSGDGRLWCDVLWLPCVVAGRTHQRVKGVDPREIGSSSGYCFACGFLMLAFCGQWITMTIGRRDIRQKYGIEGNGCLDCMTVTACPWCALIQEEKEVSMREDEIEGEKLRQQYSRQPSGMTYVPGGT